MPLHCYSILWLRFFLLFEFFADSSVQVPAKRSRGSRDQAYSEGYFFFLGIGYLDWYLIEVIQDFKLLLVFLVSSV